MTGIPVYNVNNNCATGSSALFLAHQLISGRVLVLSLSFFLPFNLLPRSISSLL
jgi:hypothetical protein